MTILHAILILAVNNKIGAEITEYDVIIDESAKTHRLETNTVKENHSVSGSR
jgi:hypothetical protein